MRYMTWFSIGPRGCGRTTALIEAAKKIGATVVCGHEQHARQVEREHDVRAVSISAEPHETRGPYIFDHFALEQIAAEYERRLEVVAGRMDMAVDALVELRCLALTAPEVDANTVRALCNRGLHEDKPAPTGEGSNNAQR